MINWNLVSDIMLLVGGAGLAIAALGYGLRMDGPEGLLVGLGGLGVGGFFTLLSIRLLDADLGSNGTEHQ